MFQLTDIEWDNLMSQFVTSSLNNNYGGHRYLPYVFTKHGLLALAYILKSPIAIAMSLIVAWFVNTFA